MTFPALLAFGTDDRRSLVVIRVYEQCVQELDFVESRDVKVWLVAEQRGMRPADVSDALSTLTEWGYLVEHARGERGVRRFTLAWSVNATTKPQSPPRRNPPISAA